ncbi:MAG: MBL fold metallo-hydrolase [Pigmentiphaga sp.]
MRYTSLGSGSEGNALLIEQDRGSGRTRLMIDCGYGLREIEQRLGLRGIEPQSLSAILVTHEHADHIGGVFRLAKRYQVPVVMTRGTFDATSHKLPAGLEVRCCVSEQAFVVQDLEIFPFAVPHDAREPVQFAIDDGHARLGVVTDLGHATDLVKDVLKRCQGIVLESNHCPELLMQSAYPLSVRNRIKGLKGHLSNEQAADLLEEVGLGGINVLHAAHISQRTNLPERVVRSWSERLDLKPEDIGIACQFQGFDWAQV